MPKEGHQWVEIVAPENVTGVCSCGGGAGQKRSRPHKAGEGLGTAEAVSLNVPQLIGQQPKTQRSEP